ncbi:MAG: hypothetical protein WB812_01775, partial [Woeseiaceae bacterium]
VVLLWAATGGSGTRNFVGVFDRDGQTIRNVSTAPLGDRVQVREARVDGAQIVLDVVQQGPDDPACCPGEKATHRYELHGGTLRELPADTQGRVGIADLAGVDKFGFVATELVLTGIDGGTVRTLWFERPH